MYSFNNLMNRIIQIWSFSVTNFTKSYVVDFFTDLNYLLMYKRLENLKIFNLTLI